MDTPKRTLLKNVVGGGLGIEYNYTRAPSMLGATYNTLQLFFKNHLQKPISNIKIGKMSLPEGMELVPFPEISALQPGESADSQMSIKFPSVSSPAKFEITTDLGVFNITLAPNIGDLVRPAALSPEEFADAEKTLKGMNELSDTLSLKDPQSEVTQVSQRVLQCAYLSPTESDYDAGRFKFAGKTMLNDELLLLSVTVDKSTGSTKLVVNSENTVLNAMLLKQLKNAIVGQAQ